MGTRYLFLDRIGGNIVKINVFQLEEFIVDQVGHALNEIGKRVGID